MTKQEMINLMESSKTEKEWNDNCDVVKKTFNGYPDFWWAEIMLSGLCNRVMAKF